MFLSIVCVIQFCINIVLYIMLTKNRKNRFIIDDYEYIILSLCKSIIRQIGFDFNIDDIVEEVKNQFYAELQEENIIITDTNDHNVTEYIKNLIYINNLVLEDEINDEDENNPDEYIDNTESQDKSVCILDSINDFYS